MAYREEKKNHNQTILLYDHVQSGETVWNGFIGGETTCTAPEYPKGLWSLSEIVSPNNTHIGWEWRLEKES